MQLIQILLPLYDNAGEPLPSDLFNEVRQELADRFGGLTAYSRAPAHGVWKDEGETQHDDIVVFEVMAAQLDTAWWRDYRRALENRFRQREIIIRAQDIIIL